VKATVPTIGDNTSISATVMTTVVRPFQFGDDAFINSALTRVHVVDAISIHNNLNPNQRIMRLYDAIIQPRMALLEPADCGEQMKQTVTTG
jgi:hypothetical protein